MFVDHINSIELVAGKGGDGIVSWIRAKYIPKGGPGGGNGGKGGDVVFYACENVSSLEDFVYKKIIKAADGTPGGKNKSTGACAPDQIVKVPVGSVIKDLDTGSVIADLDSHGSTFIVCKGGIGGRGNASFATSSNRVPFICTEGKPGEIKRVSIELRCIADFGFVGLPNAGKSSLLKSITGSEAKVGDYPFTTMFPNLGTIKRYDGKIFTFADVPGIVDGASDGRGLGIKFLKHILRCKLLIFVLDVQEDLYETFDLLKNEVYSFDSSMKLKKIVVVINKIDLVNIDEDAISVIRSDFKEYDLFFMSSVTRAGIEDLLQFLIN